MDSEIETSLVEVVDGGTDSVKHAVDYKGQALTRSNSGNWRSAWFVIGVEVGERFAYYGILSNLITYLTGPLRLTTAAAAETINVWIGTAMLTPIFGAFLADSYLGRYRTIILASLLYVLGLSLLTVSAMLPFECDASIESESCSPKLQVKVMQFFISLYMVAIGQGGHKPCVQAFGADQFDEHHPTESRDRSSFFNWWYFGMCGGILLSLLTLNYVKDNISWALGFGIPCLAMITGLLIFLFGTKTYRFTKIESREKNAFVRIGRVFVAAIRNRGISLSDMDVHEETCALIPQSCSKQFNFLHKALIAPNGSKEQACSFTEVEEAKSILRLTPIWATCLIFAIVFAQVPTFFTKQGAAMNRTIFSGFDIPAASFQSLVYITIVIFSPIYDRIIVPILRSITKKPSGITMLQRIGIGIFFSIITIVIAALVEMRRLKLAEEYGLIDDPNATVPISILWLIPQYLLFGIAEVLTMVGLQELFYDQVPKELRSMGLALYLSIFGVGSFLSSFLISVIEEITGKDGQTSWFANNMNQAHLDYFYWLLAGLSVVGLTLFICCAKSYIYNQKVDSEIQTPLLHLHTVNGAVDYRGQPAIRSKSGYWTSAFFIIGVEVAERIAYNGIESNLITFLTGPLHQTTASAAESVNIWDGTASLMPLLGAFLADSYLGRHRTIIVASIVYILGLSLLTVSAMLPSLTNSECKDSDKFTSCSPKLQVMFFFFSLYLVALGQGGHKPCVQAFGADQFDEHHPKESKERSSFFNWWYFTMCAGILLSLFILNYIQDNVSWVLGFGIPCIIMIIALVVFLLGNKTYRFKIQEHEKNPFVRIGRVFVLAIRNRQITVSNIAFKEDAANVIPHRSSKQFKFLNKALFPPIGSKAEEACSLIEVEEAKAVLRLVPIWATSLVFGIVYAQSSTFFTKQGATMDRTISPNFDIPAASLQTLIPLAIVIFSPIYDRIFVPIARTITKNPSGITMLQRIGTGIFLSIITIVIAALVEIKRLQTAKEYGLVDEPNETLPMSVWWLFPQYFLFGIAQVFTMVGLQEFFYDQVPNELRSMGLALYLSIFGVGSYLSSFLVSIIEKITGNNGQISWFADNTNQAHLDYFYWLLSGLSIMGLSLFIFFAKSYIYSQKGMTQV
ncbi:Proton-dependent oligopeptide transporter family [Senna tora]|uniref:Proton-dependent oligopeptide transporter family n=1 Tax=Senna tora TaxID=362788 RepID=A0A834X1N7_9FABA|nr:Proton-dependent oligopeptide transporter family [Senna tora]